MAPSTQLKTTSRDIKRPPATLARTLKWPILLCSLPLFILGFLLPIYAQELGASASDIGGLFAVFSAMMLVVRPLVGLAMDRYGRRIFLLMGLGAYILAMGVFTLAETLAMLYVARLIQGLGAALTWIATYTMAAELAAPGRRGEALGEADGAGERGAVYGVLIAFSLLTWLPLHQGWWIVFLGYMGCAIIGAWLAWRCVPETRETPLAPTRMRAERRPSVASSEPATTPFRRRRWGSVPQGLSVLLSLVFLTKVSQSLVNPLLLIFLRDRFALELWQLAAAYLPAALILGFLPARMGRLSDRMGRAPLIVIGLVISALTSWALPRLPSLEWFLVVFALNAVGTVTATPAQKALVGDLVPRERWGSAFGFYTFTASLGTAVGPLLGGLLYDQVGQATPFYATAALLVVSALGAMIGLPRAPARGRSFGFITRTWRAGLAGAFKQEPTVWR